MEFEFVQIPPGTFTMGSDQYRADEKPPHRVTISRGFQMGKYEVTVGQFRAFVEGTSYRTEAETQGNGRTLTAEGWKQMSGATWRNPGFSVNEDDPVVLVSWNDAVKFCEWLSQQDGRHQYRLPTEAEWEYACRAGTSGDYVGPVDEMGWYGNNAGRSAMDAAGVWNRDNENYGKRLFENGNRPHRVGQKKANSWGLHDMHGNVWEWVADWYDKNYYLNSPSTDPQGPATRGDFRVLRGGSWHVNDASRLRSAARHGNDPGFPNPFNGFRLVRLAART